MNSRYPTPHALPKGTNDRTRLNVRTAARFLGVLALAGSLAACGDDDDQKADENSQLVQGHATCP